MSFFGHCRSVGAHIAVCWDGYLKPATTTPTLARPVPVRLTWRLGVLTARDICSVHVPHRGRAIHPAAHAGSHASGGTGRLPYIVDQFSRDSSFPEIGYVNRTNPARKPSRLSSWTRDVVSWRSACLLRVHLATENRCSGSSSPFSPRPGGPVYLRRQRPERAARWNHGGPNDPICRLPHPPTT